MSVSTRNNVSNNPKVSIANVRQQNDWVQKKPTVQDTYASTFSVDRWTLIYDGQEYSIPIDEEIIEVVLMGVYNVLNKILSEREGEVSEFVKGNDI